jgi:arsenite methyltransferase
VLEAGCGSGLLLREIGAAVGEQGLAIGIDVSPDQLTAARSHCKDMTQVQVRVEDMRAVAAADELFDATVSVQVLEYVPDVETAVAEAARVTKPGGRFVNVATNWGSLWWAGGEAELTARMVSAWHGHAPHPNLSHALCTHSRRGFYLDGVVICDADCARPTSVTRVCAPVEVSS